MQRLYRLGICVITAASLTGCAAMNPAYRAIANDPESTNVNMWKIQVR